MSLRLFGRWMERSFETAVNVMDLDTNSEVFDYITINYKYYLQTYK